MCAKLPCMLTTYAEYTRKSWLTEDESKRHENTKASCGQK